MSKPVEFAVKLTEIMRRDFAESADDGAAVKELTKLLEEMRTWRAGNGSRSGMEIDTMINNLNAVLAGLRKEREAEEEEDDLEDEDDEDDEDDDDDDEDDEDDEDDDLDEEDEEEEIEPEKK